MEIFFPSPKIQCIPVIYNLIIVCFIVFSSVSHLFNLSEIKNIIKLYISLFIQQLLQSKLSPGVSQKLLLMVDAATVRIYD